MKTIRLMSMLAGSLALVGFALTQTARADDCDDEAQQMYDDCMANNNVPQATCDYMACEAYYFCEGYDGDDPHNFCC
jgi:hypothetical protein